MLRFSRLVVALGLLASVPAAVEAQPTQSCGMLAPGDPPIGNPAPEAIRQDAVETVQRALEEHAVSVLAGETERAQLEECRTLECGADLATTLEVDFVVLVTVWAPRRRPTSVVVTLIGPSESVAGDAPVEGGDVQAAAVEALTAARQRWQTAQMGYVVVESQPPGAQVFVDDRPVGETPVRHLVARGERTVRVMLEGYEPEIETVQLEASGERTLRFELTEVGSADVLEVTIAPTRGASEPHFANWLIGGGLALAGAVALAYPIQTLARDGECLDAACSERLGFDAASGIFLAAGLLALAGGVTWMILQPIQLRVGVGPDRAEARIAGRF